MKSYATKQALANALKQLLQKKQITKITINDITETCGISRMTFYYHFKDIYDLAVGPCRKRFMQPLPTIVPMRTGSRAF